VVALTVGQFQLILGLAVLLGVGLALIGVGLLLDLRAARTAARDELLKPEVVRVRLEQTARD